MVFAKKERGVFTTKTFRYFGFVTFFNALALCCVMTVWAIYIDSFVHNASLTGIISAFLTFISFCAYFVLIPLIEKRDKGKLFVMTLFLTAIFYSLLYVTTNFFYFLFLAVSLTVLSALRISLFGVILNDNSRHDSLITNEGVVFTFLNLGWVVGPLLAAYVLTYLHIEVMFLFAGAFTTIALCLFLYAKISDSHTTKTVHKNVRQNFRVFFNDRRRMYAYILGGGVSMLPVLIYLYVPLYLLKEGYSTSFIGYFLFFVALPLIILEYPFAQVTKKIGFKKAFSYSFFATALVFVCCFLTTSNYIMLMLLITTSIGFALLEPMTDAYLLSITKKADTGRFYGPYSTTRDVAQFIAKIVPAVLLLYFPFNILFVFFAAVYTIMGIIAMRLPGEQTR